MRPSIATLVFVLAMPAASNAASAFIAPSPTLPAYGQELNVEVRNFSYPAFLPATRYTVNGNVIDVEYQFVSDEWSMSSPFVGPPAVSVGELPPGNYTVNARFYDKANPSAPPQTISTNVPVLAPDAWGIYSVPHNPVAYTPMWAMVRSAVYYDAASMHATISNGVIRVDFDYYGDAPTGGPAPAGSTSYGSVKLPALPPGHYRLEGWGRPKAGGDSALYFSSDVAVGSASPVVEYYAAPTEHYFLTGGPGDIAGLDPGTLTWKRTGETFKAWLNPADAPPGAVPVCRFYAAGPNSHFYTGNASDCAGLKALEAQQRAEASAKNTQFLGWQYEQIAFYALVPTGGSCPGGTEPVYRMFNGPVAKNGANHRFTSDSRMRYAMLAAGWVDEGVQFCSPL